MAKGLRLDIRMSEDEKADLYQRAEELDMKPTDYVRMLLFPVDTEPCVINEMRPITTRCDDKVKVGCFVGKAGRNYTGETACKFGKVMREYVAEDGSVRWE